jgi:hypothetical protein
MKLRVSLELSSNELIRTNSYTKTKKMYISVSAGLHSLISAYSRERCVMYITSFRLDLKGLPPTAFNYIAVSS